MTATAAAPTISKLPEEFGWKDSNGPEFFKFERPGDTIAGMLVDVKEIKISDKLVKQYTLQLDNGLVKFNGTYSIMELLGAHHIGRLVRVRYLGDDIALGTQQNPLKLFQVQTKEKPQPRVVGPHDDIGA